MLIDAIWHDIKCVAEGCGREHDTGMLEGLIQFMFRIRFGSMDFFTFYILLKTLVTVIH